MPAEPTMSIARTLPHKDVLYVSDILDSRVDIYPLNTQDPSPIGSIVQRVYIPTGLAVDAAHDLLVANNETPIPENGGKGLPTHVNVYPPGSDRSSGSYWQGVDHPTDVAVGADGTVYVANFGDGSVSEYAPGSMTPSQRFQPPSGSAVALALDAQNNLYVACATSNAVFEFAPGSTQGTNLGLVLGGEPHGMAFDASGDLIVAVSTAPNSGSVVDVFAPGSKTPSKKITGTFQPFMIALDKSQRHLYVADFGSGNHDGGVFEYTYPAGRLVTKYSKGGASGAYGVGISPPSVP
ncbi:MAG TPA: hypothetical protein VFO25_13995 [Candidatus Eremiobacteraceae bacterium]|nr:hypothetical protein [Candidatus Eremiobacteraceae bacterium]